MPFIARNSTRMSLKILDACLFCARETGEPEKHIAEHLRDIAFALLPWPRHATYNDALDGQSLSRSTASNPGTRQTVGDMKDLLEASFEEFSESKAIENHLPASLSQRLYDFGFIPEVSA
jgi:hypothetical protein